MVTDTCHTHNQLNTHTYMKINFKSNTAKRIKNTGIIAQIAALLVAIFSFMQSETSILLGIGIGIIIYLLVGFSCVVEESFGNIAE